MRPSSVLVGVPTAVIVLITLGACAAGATSRPQPPPEAAGSSPASTDQHFDASRRGVDPASVLETGQRLVVTVDDVQYGLRNGGTVRLGNGVTAEVYLDPYPPSTLNGTLDVLLRRDGRAVKDGSVSVAYDMLAMDHGPFNATATELGGGHFVVTLRYFMFGSWEQTLAIRAGAERLELPLVVIAHP